MTIHRWDRSQRAVPDHLLGKLCDLYDKPIRWFLTLEEGDLEQENDPVDGRIAEASTAYRRKGGPDATDRVYRKIADAPSKYMPLIEKVVEDILDGLSPAGANQHHTSNDAKHKTPAIISSAFCV